MAFRTVQGTSAYNRAFDQVPSVAPVSEPSWIRNPSWSTLPSMTSGDSKFIGLVAVYPDAGDSSNFLALSVSGNYTVDWGDGVVENYSGGVSQHIYDYYNSGLIDTNAPVVFRHSGSLIERNNHGYQNGMEVQFYNVTSVSGIGTYSYSYRYIAKPISGIYINETYYVTNATTNTFQITNTPSGSIFPFNNGSGNLLRYKQAIVTITPQSGSNLTHIDLNVKHNQSGLQAYGTPWLDIKLGSPNLTYLRFHNYTTSIVNHYDLENVEILNLGTINSIQNLFYNLRNLKNASLPNVVNCVSMRRAFSECRNLKVAPTLNAPNCIDMSLMFENCINLTSAPISNTIGLRYTTGMFSNCSSLQYPPLFENLSKVTGITSGDSMFLNCSTLKTAPLFDTSNMIIANSMFQGCYNLTSIPAYNLQNVTGVIGMLSGCASLQNIPIFNISKATNATAMFARCSSLRSIPTLDTKSVTNMSNMFLGCADLLSAPALNTNKVISMRSMFDGCSAIESISYFNTSAVTDMANMFYNCARLTLIPQFDFSKVNDAQSMYFNCKALKYPPSMNLAPANLDFLFQNCSSLENAPLILASSIPSNASSMFANCANLKIQPKYTFGYTTNRGNVFSNCISLEDLPDYDGGSLNGNSSVINCASLNYFPYINISNTANPTTLFTGCASLAVIDATGNVFSHNITGCKLSAGAITKYLNNLGTQPLTGRTINISNNWGNDVYTKTISSNAQSNILTCSDTSSLSIGMAIVGSGTSIGGCVVVSDVTADTITLNSHGLTSGTRLSFSNVGTTTAVAINTIYYPVNITTDTFKLASTSSGSTINLTGTNSNMTLRYTTFISDITPSSIILDLPACSSITSGTWTFTTVDPYTALHRNWTITY